MGGSIRLSMGGAGSQLPINRRKQKKWLLSQANIRMAGCGHLVSLATRMADLSAVAPYSAKAYSKNLASVWAERGRAAMEKTAIECQRSSRWRGDRRRSVVASGKM